MAGGLPRAPSINQATGSQTLVEFADIRQRVHDKIKEYNLTSHHTPTSLSENAVIEEEKKEGSRTS